MTLRTLIIFVSLLWTSCIQVKSIRNSYYDETLKSYKLRDKLKAGDSLHVYIGDSIPFKYGRNKIGLERGELLVVKNSFNNLEYFELGEWTDHHYGDRLSSKTLFDKKLGLVKESHWNYFSDTPTLSIDVYRVVKNDSLIEVVNSYHRNGTKHLERTYYVLRGTNKKRMDFEKEIKIGTWLWYSESGQQTRKKKYSKFRLE